MNVYIEEYEGFNVVGSPMCKGSTIHITWSVIYLVCALDIRFSGPLVHGRLHHV
jgi:hypothetical protein